MATVNQDQPPDWRSLHVAEQMQHLLETGFLSDCSFLVGEDRKQAESISAHKLILCRASEVFTLMFTGAVQEKGKVRVKDISPRDFKAMLKYIYTEKLDLSDFDMSLQVMMAANKYHIVPLVNKCVEFATEKIQPGDVCRVLHEASLLENKQLEHEALEVLREKTEEIINASSWVDTPSSVVLTVLQQDCLNVSSELSLLTACDHWSRHHVSIRKTARDLLDQFLPYLRLRTLTTEQFTKFTLGDDCIFTTEECMQILQCIVTPGMRMISCVCDLTVPRKAPLMPAKDEELMSFEEKCMQHLSSECMLRLSCISPDVDAPPPLVLCSNKHVLLTGFEYFSVKTSSVDVQDRDLMMHNDKYREIFTLLLIDVKTNTCVKQIQFDQDCRYDIWGWRTDINPPYLLKKNTKLVLKVAYHEEVLGKRCYFGMESPSESPFIFSGYVTGLMGINKIFYQVVEQVECPSTTKYSFPYDFFFKK